MGSDQDDDFIVGVGVDVAFEEGAEEGDFLEEGDGVDALRYFPVDEPVDVAVFLDGQWIRARTIDLSVDWDDIRDQLLCLLGPASPTPSIS